MNAVAYKIRTLRQEAAEHKKALRHHRYQLRMKQELIRQFEMDLKYLGIQLKLEPNKKGVGANHGQRTPP